MEGGSEASSSPRGDTEGGETCPAANAHARSSGGRRGRKKKKKKKRRAQESSKPANIADLLCSNFGLDELTRQVEREMSAAAAAARKGIRGGAGRGKGDAVAPAQATPANAAEDVAELYVKVHGRIPPIV